MIRIVHMKILGGWFVVRGAHWFPLAGPFAMRADAKAWLTARRSEMKILQGHTSPDTAYVVDDYPYGFRLRCKIRYWLEYKAKHGFRLVSQTTNPKRAGEVWNKPKASTYCMFAVMVINEDNGHVSWSGLNAAYSDATECKAWADKWGEGLDEQNRKALNVVIAAKTAYEQKRKAEAGAAPTHTLPLDVGLKEAREAFIEGVRVVEMKPTDEGVAEIHNTLKTALGD